MSIMEKVEVDEWVGGGDKWVGGCHVEWMDE
jgi:hypothetical protein